MPNGNNSNLKISATATATAPDTKTSDTKQDQKLSAIPAPLMSAAAMPAMQIFDLQAQLNALKTDSKLTTLDFSQLKVYGNYIETDPTEYFARSSIRVMAGLPDGRLAVVIHEEHKIYLYDIQVKMMPPTLEGHTGEVQSLLVLPDGRLVSSARDGTIKFWNTTTGNCLATLEGRVEKRYEKIVGIEGLAVLPNGRLASNAYYKILIWDTKTYQCIKTLEVDGWLSGHSSGVTAVAALDDNTIATTSLDKTIKIWNLTTAKCMHTLKGLTRVTGFLTLPNHRLLSSSSDDKTIKVWDYKKGKLIKTLETDNVNENLILLNDGRFACGAIWNSETYQRMNYLPAGNITQLTDGQIASGWFGGIRLSNPKPTRRLTLADIEPVLAALPHSAVTMLNLQNCALTDQDIPKLVAHLQNTTLTSLDLRQTSITAKGAKALEDALKHHPTLKQILPTSKSMEEEQLARNFSIILNLANRGDVNAQSLVGEAYLGGIGVEQNLAQAISWLNKAAKGNNADAQNNLGLCYENGRFVDMDFDMASEWYKCAVTQGHAGARANLTRVQTKQKEYFEEVTKIASVLAASMTQVLNSDQQTVTAAAGSAAIPPPSAPLYNLHSPPVAGTANHQKETLPTNRG